MLPTTLPSLPSTVLLLLSIQYKYTYIYVYACGPKTALVKRTLLNIAILGWSGVGEWGMLTYLVLRTWSIATLLRSLGSFATLHVATLLMGWGGGWGMLTYLVLRTWSIAMLEPLMLHGLLLRTSSPIHWAQKAKIFSCMSSAGNGDMSMDTVASSKKLSRRWNAWSDKGWKRVLHIFAKNPHETQIWPNLRAQIWPNFAYQTVCFAVAKTICFFENVRFVSAVSGLPGCLWISPNHFMWISIPKILESCWFLECSYIDFTQVYPHSGFAWIGVSPSMCEKTIFRTLKNCF